MPGDPTGGFRPFPSPDPITEAPPWRATRGPLQGLDSAKPLGNKGGWVGKPDSGLTQTPASATSAQSSIQAPSSLSPPRGHPSCIRHLLHL